MKLILASGSPRRAELLGRLGLQFEVLPAQIDESLLPGLTAEEQVLRLAREKALAVRDNVNEDAVILSADTVVVLDGEILGKPKDEADAFRMLRLLSGREHLVMTGVTVLSPRGEESICEKTHVHFRPLNDGEIRAYIRSGEPMDKAGAYGIQGKAALFVSALSGDYFNVVGLPLCASGAMLRRAGIPILEDET